VTTLQRWTGAACAELGLAPAVIDERLILDLTQMVAHRVDRPAAPLNRLAEAWPDAPAAG
jgi:hypothetical protein